MRVNAAGIRVLIHSPLAPGEEESTTAQLDGWREVGPREARRTSAVLAGNLVPNEILSLPVRLESAVAINKLSDLRNRFDVLSKRKNLGV
jgi:hypothetical protein